MKTIGLLGGMSFESTVIYYNLINKIISYKLGNFNSAKIILNSVNFNDIVNCQLKNNWRKSSEILGKAAQSLENSGADFILICSNTMHKVYDEIKSYVNIPIIHIVDVLSKEIKENDLNNIILFGTKYTMEEEFYKNRLIKNGINVLIPDEEDRIIINNIIFNELCKGEIKESSRNEYIKIINKLKIKGAEGIILGCTEIGLLISDNYIDLPLFDTTKIHSKYAVEYALNYKTDRLLIRPFKLSDADLLYKYASDKELAYNCGFKPIDNIDESRYIIKNVLDKAFAIVIRNTNKLIGAIAIKNIDNEHEIGYWIGKEYQNNGYGTEALNLIINIGFNVLGLDSININHFEGNNASKRLIEKAKFKYIGTQKNYYVKLIDKKVNRLNYVLNREDLE